MDQWLSTFIVLFVAIALNGIHGANILVYLPSPAPSHSKPFQPLCMALANRGHNVTVVSMFPPNQRIENYTHLQVGDDFKFSSSGFAYLREQTRVENYIFIYHYGQLLTKKLINETHTRMLLQSQSKFDLIMMEIYFSDTFFSLGGHFNAPIIGLSFQPLQPIYSWITKNPWNPSYIPHLYLPFSDQMDFTQRLMNALFGIFTLLMHYLVCVPTFQNQIDALMASANVEKMSKLEDMTKNLSLILVESHYSIQYPRPYVPNVVEVAGVHISPSEQLPKDIETFINEAQNGVVYVSMGTLVTPDTMEELGLKLINIFRKLPYGVIWKWNPKLVPNVTNILAREWLPQMDILNHPKTKLFVSHAGYHSIIEAVNGGIPLLCLPFFTDQYHNAAIVEKYEFGKKENLDVSEQDLFNSIAELLSNKKYAENAKLRSRIFKDRPMSPLDSAVYWTEYVIRHNGASHLKTAAVELSWYQYFLLDVIFFAILAVLIIVYVIKKCINIFYKFSTGKYYDKIKTN